MCLNREYVSFLMYPFMLSWLQTLCAIPCSVQTLTYCHGSDSNAIHFLYLTPAMIKCNASSSAGVTEKHFIMAGTTS